jgi:hypothetical protein
MQFSIQRSEHAERPRGLSCRATARGGRRRRSRHLAAASPSFLTSAASSCCARGRRAAQPGGRDSVPHPTASATSSSCVIRAFLRAFLCRPSRDPSLHLRLQVAPGKPLGAVPADRVGRLRPAGEHQARAASLFATSRTATWRRYRPWPVRRTSHTYKPSSDRLQPLQRPHAATAATQAPHDLELAQLLPAVPEPLTCVSR